MKPTAYSTLPLTDVVFKEGRLPFLDTAGKALPIFGHELIEDTAILQDQMAGNAWKHLAWLNLNEQDGHDYWVAMQLAHRYAMGNHAQIHHKLADALAHKLGATQVLNLANAHNLAWQEEHSINGKPETVMVHRKGATPSRAGQLGIIPGTMAHPAHVVVGKGNPLSLQSSSHGAGRVMSRNKAKANLPDDWRDELAAKHIALIGSGKDEAPAVYKNIADVIALQHELIDSVGLFHPVIVRMAGAGEKAED